MNLRSAVLSIVVLGCVSFTAKTAIIVSSDFDNRAISSGSATATNINWLVNGVSALNDLTADAPLFNTADAQSRIAVKKNIQTSGPWSIDFALNVLSQDILLSNLFLDAYIFNNSGITQVTSNTSRDVDFKAVILDSASQNLAQKEVLNVFPSNGAYTPGKKISFDFSGTTLFAGNNYTLQLVAFSNEKLGNNAGFDNFSLTGTLQTVSKSSTAGQPVSAPSIFVLFSTFLFALFLRKKLA